MISGNRVTAFRGPLLSSPVILRIKNLNQRLKITLFLIQFFLVEGGKFMGTRTKSHASHVPNNFLIYFYNLDRQ